MEPAIKGPVFPGGIWGVDFEFRPIAGIEGNPIEVVCMVAREFGSDVELRLWGDQLAQLRRAPFPTGGNALFVAYGASVEAQCIKALGWTYPEQILDLYPEFRNHTNGRPGPSGNGLVGALAYFGEPCMDVAEKDEMRALELRGGPFSPEEKAAILDYCERDVDALLRLFKRMQRKGLLDWPRALWRGQSAIATAEAASNGIPIDLELLDKLRSDGPAIAASLIKEVDENFGVYEDGHFRILHFRRLLESKGIEVPLTSTGRVSVSEDSLAELAIAHPQFVPLHQLRKLLVNLRSMKLTVGVDGRNRYAQFPFASKTGRSQPSTSKSIFCNPSALRPLIRPQLGFAVAYVDYAQQEPGIAAAQSGDLVMQAAYRAEDFHMSSAISAGVAPKGATKASHPEVRESFKQVSLGVLYGMTEHGLSRRLGISLHQAQVLLDAHRNAFTRFWRWSDAVVDHALLMGKLSTVYGWTLHVERSPNVRSLRNFLMQATGAEMLRLAADGLVRRGIRLCATVHDAVLIEAPVDEIDAAVAITQAVMSEASMLVLDGFEIKTDVKVVRFPDRFIEPKGQQMWMRLLQLLDEFPQPNLD